MQHKWRKGQPPNIGWYPASPEKNPERIRWWNGQHWSVPCMFEDNEKIAGFWATVQSGIPNQGMYWTDPWWL